MVLQAVCWCWDPVLQARIAGGGGNSSKYWASDTVQFLSLLRPLW